MKNPRSTGLTLLELMVSISVSAIVITLALSSWNYLNKHILYQESKRTVRGETARVAEEIALKLGRTPGLLRFTDNSVTFIEQNGGDTLEYAFTDETYITKNGVPMYFGVQGGSITSFSLRNTAAGDSEYLLLEVTVSSKDTRGNRDTCRVIVNVKKNNAEFSWSDNL